ncbi:MAG: HD domain-containing phosphohydrolase, partial [Gemmataceae bacterium]
HPIRWMRPIGDSALESIACQACNIAQVTARLALQDYEWAAEAPLAVLAALLMDVGELRKTGADDRRGWEQHPRVSGELVHLLLPEAREVVDAILTHHEHLDGTGVPNGFQAGSIPTLGRLLAVANAYTVRRTGGWQQAALDSRSALSDCLLAAETGILDRDFTEYLLNFTFHPVGTVVELADRRIAVVVATANARANIRLATRPIVAVLTDGEGNPLPRPEVVDLSQGTLGGIIRSLTSDECRKIFAESYPDLAR